MTKMHALCVLEQSQTWTFYACHPPSTSMCLTIQFPNPCPLGCEASIALVQLLIDKVGELRMVCVHILASLIAICSLSPPSLFLPPALPAVFFFLLNKDFYSPNNHQIHRVSYIQRWPWTSFALAATSWGYRTGINHHAWPSALVSMHRISFFQAKILTLSGESYNYYLIRQRRNVFICSKWFISITWLG